jgi:predicted enzyme related to lactoylglutathione lyase
MCLFPAAMPDEAKPKSRTPMEGRITSVSLVVTNQVESLEFFTEKVGFEKKTDFTGPGGFRWVTVGPDGGDLELVLFQLGSATDPAQKEWSKQWSPGKAPPIMLRVADCRKTYDELQSRGVKFPQPPFDHPWGTSATFADPDGNLFSLSEPPKGSWSKT